MHDYYLFHIDMYMTMCTLYSINLKQIIDYENSISKCNFEGKIGKFVFFRVRRNTSPLL